MNKKDLSRFYARIRKVKVWYLLVPLVISSSVCAMALRHNNLQMIQLRDAVYQADKSGNNVEGALYDLRTYVYDHMNTGLSTSSSVYPPIQLKYTYQRLLQAAQTQVAANNTQTYADAQHYCEAQIPNGFSGRYRISCIESYVSSHGGQQAVNIPSAMYKFDFVSPRWSPDLAGFSLLTSILFGILLVLRVALGWSLRRLT